MTSVYLGLDSISSGEKKSKIFGKRSYFSLFFKVFSTKKRRKKQAASKKEAGGDAKHVFFFTSP